MKTDPYTERLKIKVKELKKDNQVLRDVAEQRFHNSIAPELLIEAHKHLLYLKSVDERGIARTTELTKLLEKIRKFKTR